jgi:hypothetical protein
MSESVPIDVEYELERGDLVEFSKVILTQPAGVRDRKQRVARGALGLAVVAASLVALAILSESSELALGVAGCLAVFVVLTLILWRWQGGRTVLLGEICCRRRARIDPEGFTDARDGTTTHHKWRTIERILSSDRLVVLVTGPNQGYLIPRRAFVDDAAFRKFGESAEQFRQAERQDRQIPA